MPPGSPKLKTFAFKCHREKNEIYPVNALGFHVRNTFLTAGGDGCVYTWDKDVRHKLGSLENLKFQLPIIDAKFAPMVRPTMFFGCYIEWKVDIDEIYISMVMMMKCTNREISWHMRHRMIGHAVRRIMMQARDIISICTSCNRRNTNRRIHAPSLRRNNKDKVIIIIKWML